MEIYFSSTEPYFFVLPFIILSRGHCEDADCQEEHGLQIEIGWLCWEIRIEFQPFQEL